MSRKYSDLEVGIVQIHTGHPLELVHDCNDGLQSLNLKQSLANNEVEELQV